MRNKKTTAFERICLDQKETNFWSWQDILSGGRIGQLDFTIISQQGVRLETIQAQARKSGFYTRLYCPDVLQIARRPFREY
jgi:hypothetical protein